MRTYTFFYVLLACCIVFCCSTSDEGEIIGKEDDTPNIEADYTLLMEKGDLLTGTLLNANVDVITKNPAESAFPEISLPQLTYRDGSMFGVYHKKGVCSGEILTYDFEDTSSIQLDVFDDLMDCELTANAISGTENSFFIAYELEVTSKEKTFFVRILDLDSTPTEFVDVALDKKPLQMIWGNNRLFILALDDKITDENVLFVIDTDTNSLIHEMNLGFDARRIFKTPDKNIIISYDELHTTLNSTTMSYEYTQYGEGTEPNFTTSNSSYFDSTGKMYYDMYPDSNSIYPIIPAVYDFETNLAILYAYENFLTEAQRNFELEIETTTMVSYDEENELMLIGYKKSSNDGKGGLLRIKPIPNPEFVDNLDLEGIPHQIFIN